MVIVRNVTFSRNGGISRFEALIHFDTAPEPDFTARIDIHKEIDCPETPGDPFLAACLLPAMHLGETLEVRAPVSRRMQQAIQTIQDIHHCWFPAILTRVPVITPHLHAAPGGSADRGSACFFSGGLDSWYSLLKHQDTAGALITVKGFDIPFNDQAIWGGLIDANRRIAAIMGMESIAIETNLRDCVDPTFARIGKPRVMEFWGNHLHGAFLAAVGLCLQKTFNQLIVPASVSYAQLFPWGSHPLLDTLWSTEQSDFLHDGCEASRMQKLLSVATSETALHHLRVCPTYTSGRYNCCECEKCWRTMLGLRMLGVLDKAASFDKPLDLPFLIKTMQVPTARLDHHQIIIERMYLDMLAEARSRGNSEMVQFLQVILGEKRSPSREYVRMLNLGKRCGTSAARVLGLQRHARSIRKRWNRIRSLTGC